MYIVFQCTVLGSSESAVKSAWLSGTIPQPTHYGLSDTMYAEITKTGITEEIAQRILGSVSLIQIDSHNYSRSRLITRTMIKNLPAVTPSRKIQDDDWDATIQPAWMRAASVTSLANL